MKAAQVKNYGGTEAIEINPKAQEITVSAGHVLVDVKSASLNRIDSAIRNGYLAQMLPLNFPITLGGDFAGIVKEVGEGIADIKVGDAVYGNAGHFKGGPGALADVTSVAKENVALKPKTLDFAKSAALALVGTTALQGIVEEIKIQPGQKVLIQGGAGGVGSIAVQLAKLHGAYVATTVGTDDVELAKSLGADEVIDYKTQDVTTILKDYDAVFDTAGGENINALFAILKKGGILVTVAGQPDQELAKKSDVTALNQVTTVSPEQLTQLAQLVDEGKINVSVEKIFPFTQVKEAFEYFETQHPKGNIVVEIS